MRKNNRQMIRRALETYPGGICFALDHGRPVLVNRKLNELVSIITGHTVLNAVSLWEELKARSNLTWEEKTEALGFLLPDGSVWRFRRELLPDGDSQYIQIEAADVTDLYHRGNDLAESNERLRRQSLRQRTLLTEIVQTNREKELLRVKMRVHAELGRCIIATQKTLTRENAPLIAQAWEDAIRDFSNITREEPWQQDSMELMQVAKMIGCRISFTGSRPRDSGARQLLFAAVREALTNAVRHGSATELLVDCSRRGKVYHAEISDNGRGGSPRFQEGGGLSGLRKRLEQEGAALELDTRQGVRLIVDIPVLEDREEEEET